ncbi:MAG: imidazoleglycerol-phosphate dehydratase HisB [Puniceicoccales bacterium]|jgi:imidazoleglycerol-phosphate dehydratase|nr:imidazoleglycerol-phosphate dehydratase HisB [Puniceicoccales bacterium]
MSTTLPPAKPRTATLARNTAETQIELSVNLDGTGKADVNTGVPFLDHMLTLLARHSLLDLTVAAKGDIAVDYHHTVEDVGIVLGTAIKEALGDKRGIRRYGFFILPMDESLARVALDLGNRPMLVYRVETANYMIRDFNVALVREFFQGLANNLGANVHILLEYGDEPHHIAEAIYKAFARALAEAVSLDPRQAGSLPSTKGLL